MFIESIIENSIEIFHILGSIWFLISFVDSSGSYFQILWSLVWQMSSNIKQRINMKSAWNMLQILCRKLIEAFTKLKCRKLKLWWWLFQNIFTHNHLMENCQTEVRLIFTRADELKEVSTNVWQVCVCLPLLCTIIHNSKIFNDSYINCVLSNGKPAEP